jgi:hypothetical protein
MPSACVHPTPDDVGRLLTQLLGRRVVAKRGAPSKSAVAVSSYAAEAGGLATVCAFDLEFANFAGAALPMVPPAVAIDAIRAKKVEPEMMENLQEVANIMAGLFSGTHVQVKLRHCGPVPPPPPADVTAVAAKPARRLDLDIDVTGYGLGKVSIYFALPPIPPGG